MKENVTDMFVALMEKPDVLVQAAKSDSDEAKKATNEILEKALDAGEDEKSCTEKVESLCDAAWNKVTFNKGAKVNPYASPELCVRDKNSTNCGVF